MLAIDTIVVPQGAEYQAVCRGLQQGGAANLQVITIPIGFDNIKQILANYFKQLANSKQIIIIGLCGSLSKSYGIGDQVLVQSCQDFRGNRVDLNAELTAKIHAKLSLDSVAGLTSDRLIFQAQEKYEFGQKYNAKVVEMEGYGYVKELQQQGKSVAMLRVVSDDLAGDLPNLNNIIDSQGNIKVVAMAIAFLKQPIAALRLIRGSLIGLKALESITAKLFDTS